MLQHAATHEAYRDVCESESECGCECECVRVALFLSPHEMNQTLFLSPHEMNQTLFLSPHEMNQTLFLSPHEMNQTLFLSLPIVFRRNTLQHAATRAAYLEIWELATHTAKTLQHPC